MTKFLKYLFATACIVGMILIMCAASTLDHGGSIPISDWQCLTLAIIGGAIAFTGIMGFNSLDHKKSI